MMQILVLLLPDSLEHESTCVIIGFIDTQASVQFYIAMQTRGDVPEPTHGRYVRNDCSSL